MRLQCAYMQDLSAQIRYQISNSQSLNQQTSQLEKEFAEKQYKAYMHQLNKRLDQLFTET